MDWNEEKRRFLIRHYGKLPPEEIAEQLDTTKMSVQVKASRLKLTNGRHKRRREEGFGAGREYGLVERRRALKNEEIVEHRNHLCPHYGMCLDYAVDMNWRSWSCKECRHFKAWGRQGEKEI